MRRHEGGKVKRKKPLKRISDKRFQDNISYIMAREQWKSKRISEDGFWRCEFKFRKQSWWPYDEDGRCWEPAVDVHHRKGRGKYLCLPRYYMGLCRHHHSWIHDHPKEARKKRYILT